MNASANFNFDAQEYYRALRQTVRYNPVGRLLPLAGFGMLVVSTWLLVVRTWGRVAPSVAFVNVLPWLLIGGFYMAVVPLALKWVARKAARNEPAFRGLQTRTVSASGLQVKGAGLTQDLSWTDLVRVADTKEFFLFFYNKSAAHYLPKRTLTASDVDMVRDLVRTNLPVSQ